MPSAFALPDNVYRDGAFNMPLPTNWSPSSGNKGASNFRIAPANGAPEAQASLAVVAVAPASAVQPLAYEQRKMVGGVTFSDLRRSVIDKMITTGGWVVNDRAREIGGHHVFEVIAQTPATGDGKPEQVWNFYFTEVNGRVYSLTTRSANPASQKISADAEQFLSNFLNQHDRLSNLQNENLYMKQFEEFLSCKLNTHMLCICIAHAEQLLQYHSSL